MVNFNALQKLCKKSNISFPPNIKIKERYWYASKGAFNGWKAVVKKYGGIPGDSEYRKKKWREWWNEEGRYKKHPIIAVSMPIKKPAFSKELAEFVGIVLGDGGISQRQVAITLHSLDDKEYSKFVISLIKKLFHVPVGIHHNKGSLSIDLVVSRSELVHFCVEKLGLKKGNKVRQQVDIPNWVKENNQYAIACLRGLMDTDGCVFNHRYKVNNKFYEYKKISFTNSSNPLRQSVFNILKKNNFNPRFAPRKDVRLDSIGDVKRYFILISSHNPKYLKKYKNNVK